MTDRPPYPQTILSLDQIRRRMRFYNTSAVADAVGISRQCLYNLLKDGHDPHYSTVEKVSTFLQEN